jgi:hypothetical protein
MMNSKLVALAVVSTSLAAATPAFADEAFGATGQVILSGERLFGLSFPRQMTEDGATGNKTTQSRTNIALLWPSTQAVTFALYDIPHAAVDFGVASGFTVGGSIGFFSGSGSTKREAAMGGASVETDDATVTTITFAPRVGFALPLTPQFAFWPRAGVTYYNIGLSSTNTATPPVTNKSTLSGFGVNLEPMFVFTPVPHFGITAGPVVDIPLSGTSHTERTPPGTNPPSIDDKVKFLNFGLTFGVLGFF